MLASSPTTSTTRSERPASSTARPEPGLALSGPSKALAAVFHQRVNIEGYLPAHLHALGELDLNVAADLVANALDNGDTSLDCLSWPRRSEGLVVSRPAGHHCK